MGPHRPRARGGARQPVAARCLSHPAERSGGAQPDRGGDRHPAPGPGRSVRRAASDHPDARSSGERRSGRRRPLARCLDPAGDRHHPHRASPSSASGAGSRRPLTARDPHPRATARGTRFRHPRDLLEPARRSQVGLPPRIPPILAGLGQRGGPPEVELGERQSHPLPGARDAPAAVLPLRALPRSPSALRPAAGLRRLAAAARAARAGAAREGPALPDPRPGAAGAGARRERPLRRRGPRQRRGARRVAGAPPRASPRREHPDRRDRGPRRGLLRARPVRPRAHARRRGHARAAPVVGSGSGGGWRPLRDDGPRRHRAHGATPARGRCGAGRGGGARWPRPIGCPARPGAARRRPTSAFRRGRAWRDRPSRRTLEAPARLAPLSQEPLRARGRPRRAARSRGGRWQRRDARALGPGARGGLQPPPFLGAPGSSAGTGRGRGARARDRSARLRTPARGRVARARLPREAARRRRRADRAARLGGGRKVRVVRDRARGSLRPAARRLVRRDRGG